MARLRLASYLTSLGLATAIASEPLGRQYCAIYFSENSPPTECDSRRPTAFLPYKPVPSARGAAQPNPRILEDAFEALTLLQSEFFRADKGTWPTAIDWTAAVLETGLAGVLTTLTEALDILNFDREKVERAKENLIDSFFSQLVGSYFGQDDVGIRLQVSISV
jgi:hypothetical protein